MRFRTYGVSIKAPLCEAFERKRAKGGWDFSECDRDGTLNRDGRACCAVHATAAYVQWTGPTFQTSGDPAAFDKEIGEAA